VVASLHGNDHARLKVWQIIGLIEADGWYLVRTRGSHRHYWHPHKPGTVTVPGKRSNDLHPKTQASILRQAGLKS
jgi:predicted RNA binding protein YcfA (HicA-like mRNA interferase family)